MGKKLKLLIIFLVILVVVVILGSYVSNHNNGFLNPKGLIAEKERNLILTELSLVLSVVIPVFIATLVIAWKYREGNKKAKYAPNWSGNKLLQLTWWAIPIILVLILTNIMWRATHDLDPNKPIINGTKPITIQVVALRWKWLFIYPEQHIASVNFVMFPEKTPVNFKLTADASMNSFWIPQLGGQMYAMTGMGTQLNLIANGPGDFAGSSAEISGKGFAGMKFTARSSSPADFDNWVKSIQSSDQMLDLSQYNLLALESENNPVTFYSLVDDDIYNKVIMKFAAPSGEPMNMNGMDMSGMEMK